MKKFILLCWMVVASAIIFSCSSDMEILNGNVEDNGNCNGGQNPDSTAYFQKVTFVDCKVDSVSKKGVNVEVKTRAAEAETDDGIVTLTVHHRICGQKWYSTDGKVKDQYADTAWRSYKGIINTHFRGFKKVRYAGSNIFLKAPEITNYEGTISLNWSGRKFAVVVDKEQKPGYVSFVEKNDTIHFSQLCEMETVNFSYIGVDSVFDQETATAKGYIFTLKFRHELEGSRVFEYLMQTYLWINKNGKDPENPEDDREVIKIGEISSQFTRDTTRDMQDLVSNIHWSRQLKYYYSDGTDTIVNTKDTTVATLGNYNFELKAIEVSRIDKYVPMMTMHARGPINGTTRNMTLGINDEEKTLTAKWTTHVHKVGNVERALSSDAYYIDFIFDKAGSYLEQISETEYIYHHRMVSEFSDGKMPQVFWWNRKITAVDKLEYREIIQKWITSLNVNFFLNLKVNNHYSGSGDKTHNSVNDLHLKLSDNGPIEIFEKLRTITQKGSIERKVLSTIKNDSLSGNRTQTVMQYDVNGKTATLNAEIDEIAKYYDKDAASGQLVITMLNTETISQSVEGIYDVTLYDMVFEVKLEDKTVEYRIRVKENILNLKPTFAGYRFIRADKTLAFRSGSKADREPGAAVEVICGWFEKIGDPTQNKYFIIERAKYDNEFNKNGRDIATALANSMSVWDNTPVEKIGGNEKCSANYTTLGHMSGWDPAGMNTAGTPGDYTSSKWWTKQGWDYASIYNGKRHGFYTVSVTLTNYNDPFLGALTEDARGIVIDGNIAFRSDK